MCLFLHSPLLLLSLSFCLSWRELFLSLSFTLSLIHSLSLSLSLTAHLVICIRGVNHTSAPHISMDVHVCVCVCVCVFVCPRVYTSHPHMLSILLYTVFPNPLHVFKPHQTFSSFSLLFLFPLAISLPLSFARRGD